MSCKCVVDLETDKVEELSERHETPGDVTWDLQSLSKQDSLSR